MEKRITVSRDGEPCYDIVFEKDFTALGGELKALGFGERKLCIVTDSHVEPLYAAEVESALADAGIQTERFVFPAGEENKNLDTVRSLYTFLIERHFGRKDCLLALGGGVAGDLTGYAAATYLRGIAFVQIPTTLLSQVDSSIGGKTGVDFDAYKNMVGAFHMPRLVYTNIGTLKTLPDSEFAAGMGEVIKHGLIRSRDYYEWLLENEAAIRSRDPQTLRRMVRGSNEIKRAVVEQDPTERGDRMLLNFGHTLGHAIEKLKDFQLLHGECVALGSLAAMSLSQARGYLDGAQMDRFERALSAFGLPVRVGGLEKEAVIRATRHDKKMDSGAIRFILLREIGCAFVDRSVTEEEMSRALDRILTA